MEDMTPTIDQLVKAYENRSLYDPRQPRKNPRSAHLDKYETMDTTPRIHVAKKPEDKVLSAEDFLQHLREGFKLYARMQHINTLYFHPQNVEMIRHIAKWITGDITGDLNPTKGLYIYGRHGSGKTDFTITLTNVAKVLARTYTNVSKFQPYSYNAVYESIRSGSDIIDVIRGRSNLALDDFLYQDRNEARVFGNDDRVADIIVTKMYDLHKAGYIHIVTSNYPPDQIDMHPGSIDRMNEMFNYIFWEGESLRR